MSSYINRLTSVLKVISVQFIFILKDYRFLLFDLNVSNDSMMGVLGDVISVGLNGSSVVGDVNTVGPNGPSVDESSMQLLEDVITEGPDGHSLGTSSVVIIYIGYIYIIYKYKCGNAGEILITLIGPQHPYRPRVTCNPELPSIHLALPRETP